MLAAYRRLWGIVGVLVALALLFISRYASAAPNPPTGTSASSASATSVQITWNSVAGATRYKVRNKTTGAETGNLFSTNYTWASLSTGVNYCFTVIACDSTSCSTDSNQACATPAAPVPNPPAGATASSASSTSVQITWNSVSGATRYKVRNKTTGAETGDIFATNYAWASLSTGVNYCFTVIACNNSGCSTDSNQACATPAAPVPSPPVGASASSASSTSVQITWNSVSGATRYKVRNKTTGAETGDIFATNYAWASLSTGVNYCFTVIACNNSGCSTDSNQACATPEGPPCGNGKLDPGEACDGQDLAGQTCASQGFAGGTLKCALSCASFDTSACTSLTDPCGNGNCAASESCSSCPQDCGTCCGNGALDAGEVCDGQNVAGQTCASQGFASGTLGCALGCASFDTSACVGSSGCSSGSQCIPGTTECAGPGNITSCVVGPDGCATLTTTACGAQTLCSQGACVVCANPGQTCGVDKCGNLVGTCPDQEICNGTVCVTSTSGALKNPTPSEIDQAVAQIVFSHPISWTTKDGSQATGYIPTLIVKSVMWRESKWVHYDDKGVLRGPVNPNGTQDYGLMQISGSVDDPILSNMGWYENINLGVIRLKEKWTNPTAGAFPFEDPSIVENWYYPLAAYNGLSLGGVNDPSEPGSINPYYEAHPQLIANHLTYQDAVIGIAESPSQWGASSNVMSQGRLRELNLFLTRPYAIPSWITPGKSWSSEGKSGLLPFTSELDSFGKPDDVPALQAYGLLLHRWVEDSNGGHVEIIAPKQAPGASAPVVTGWKPFLSTKAGASVPYAGSVTSASDPLVRLTFVVGTPSGIEIKLPTDYATGTQQVELSQFYFDPSQLGGAIGKYFVGLWVKTVSGSVLLLKTAEVSVVPDGFSLAFPLAGFSPYNAPINSVFDHSSPSPYSRDGKVVAYTGETASGTPCKGTACSYPNSSGKAFVVNGNYTGVGKPVYLWYEGHPGYDFRAKQGTKAYATAPGVVKNPLYKEKNTYNILEIDHGNGCQTQYWHCDSHLVKPGQQVQTGDPVITVGQKGAPGAPHLHLEVICNGVPVDPYGWDGKTADPYTKATNVRLWSDAPGIGGAVPCLAECVGKSTCEGEQCWLLCSNDADCGAAEACYDGICQPACGGDSCLDEGLEPDESMGGNGGTSSGAAGGSAGGAGASGANSSPAGGKPGASPETEGVGQGSDQGCGCVVGKRHTTHSAVLGVFAFLALGLQRRSRAVQSKV